MTKEYKYSVILNNISTYNTKTRITLKLDHLIDDTDLNVIEKQYSSSGLFGSTMVATNYSLLRVTGDFTYNVIYQKMEFGKWVTYSQIFTQDHKQTSSTLRSDYREFIAFLYPGNNAIAPKEWDADHTKILMFLEIPDN